MCRKFQEIPEGAENIVQEGGKPGGRGAYRRICEGGNGMYWEKEGPEYTRGTIERAFARAGELGIEDIVIASKTGASGMIAAEMLPGGSNTNLVVVSHHTGFKSPGEQEMAAETASRFESMGIKVLTTTHLFGGVERAVSKKFGGLYPGGLISETLRMFGQGTKVCAEIATMALDAGLIQYGREIIAIGGSGHGVDTALVLMPAHARDFFDGRVLEVICKPRTARGA